MDKSTKRNDPCPCGSGKKYKNCCQPHDQQLLYAQQKDIFLTRDNGKKVKRKVASFDSIPTHNIHGQRPNITKDQMLGLCSDEIYKILEKERVGMLVDLVNHVVLKMDIVPVFSYREIAEYIETDSRFEIYAHQVCSLKGDDPLTLMSEKLF